MKRGKRILAALLCALCLLPLAACHGSRGYDDFVMPENFDSSREYEISFWAKNDTNKTQTEIYQKAIADFEALYPNIHVSMRLYTDYGKIYNDVITNIATGTTPNVCITYPDHIATYLTGTNCVVPRGSTLPVHVTRGVNGGGSPCKSIVTVPSGHSTLPATASGLTAPFAPHSTFRMDPSAKSTSAVWSVFVAVTFTAAPGETNIRPTTLPSPQMVWSGQSVKS